jgi:nitric oxide reductase activation protein
MSRRGGMGMWTAMAGLALWVAGSVSMAQRGGAVPAPDPATGLPQVQSGPGGQSPLGADEAVRERTAKIAIEQERARNDDRQKRLVADTQKLLALATELKADVDRTNKDTLSVDVVKKADEIEKLAHSVKEKMKGS